jgi:hypothetical protein
MKATFSIFFIILFNLPMAHAKFGWSRSGIDQILKRYVYGCAIQTDDGNFVEWADVSNCQQKFGWSPREIESFPRRYVYGCAIQTEGGDRVEWVDNSNCQSKFGWHSKTIDREFSRYVYQCSLQTPDGDFVEWADNFKDCTQHFGWSRAGKDTNLNRSIYGCALQTSDGGFVEKIDISYCNGTAVAPKAQPQMSLEEINKNIQPPEDAQIILDVDLAVPGHKGCGVAKETKSAIQCYVCNSQTFRNGILYSGERILKLKNVALSLDKKELRFSLSGDSDGLDVISCTSRRVIPVNSPEDFVKILGASGLRYIDPGYVLKEAPAKKTEGIPQPPVVFTE